MKLIKRATAAFSAWGVLGLVLAVGVLGVSLSYLLPPAIGLGTTSAPTTVSPTLFEPPQSQAQSKPVGDGLVNAAADAQAGEPPDATLMQKCMAAVDDTSLTQDGSQVQAAWSVLDLETGKSLADSRASEPLIPASNTKLLTLTALLQAVDPGTTFDTRVVQSAPGKLVLVGGGDPLLASEPTGEYPQVATLQKLAEATAEKLKADEILEVSLGYDASLFTGPAWNPTWPQRYQDNVTPITALWADEGFDVNGVRSNQPAESAAKIFATKLREAGVKVSESISEVKAAGDEVAKVTSPPVHVLAEIAMQRSNNSFTEVLGRQLAIATGKPASFEGATEAVKEQLVAIKSWDEGASLSDCSGLSRENEVPAHMLATVLLHVAKDQRLQVVLDGLPVAGVTGTLRKRFFSDSGGSAVYARGVTKAKTGTLTEVSSLAGVTTTKDGRELAFAVIINGAANGWAAQAWVDRVVATVADVNC